jgi:hypothetical protein
MFYVYENWRAGPHHAKVHLGSCGACNDGSGMHGGTDSTNGKWHGPFPTHGQAMNEATQLASPRVTNCGLCKPQ